MGQYWRVINVDQRKHLGNWGKAAEFFFSANPDILSALLMGPAPTQTCWSGNRILCLGDYMEDLPAGLLKQSEIEEIGAWEFDCPKTLYNYASERYGLLSRLGRPQPGGGAGTLVLRNLSKYQYVREDTIAVAAFKDSDSVGLGHALLTRICWSSDGVTLRSHDLHRGVWAGDRFDITTVDALEFEDEGGRWQDVSDEVFKEMTDIWT